MPMNFPLFVALLSWCCGLVLASSSKDLFFQQFNSPPAAQRTKFRYWLPDASVSAEILKQDIADLAEVGAGGFEFLPYYQYGLIGGGPTPTDWNIYGFGTPAFKNVFDVALSAAANNGLLFDFTGAQSGEGIPSPVNTPGLSVELIYGNITLEPGESYIGTIPSPDPRFNEPNIFIFSTDPTYGSTVLKAVLALRVDKVISTPPVTFIDVDESSIIDLTPGFINGSSISFQAPTGNSTYRIVSFYERYTNSRSCSGGLHPTSFIGNGSWLVDHFSAEGANRTTSFWDQYILDDSNKEVLRHAGRYAWEDSMEFQAAAWWTPNLLNDFESARGYSLVRYLPLIFTNNAWGGSENPYDETFRYGEYDENGLSRVNVDYRTTLNEGYQRYIEHFENWAHSLGLEYSNQPAYNFPLDMQADIPLVDAPEDESLGFASNIDAYRQFSGPAHVKGTKVISNEMGAEDVAYSLTFPKLLGDVSKAFAGGSNLMVLHGSPYSGEYTNTTWPGFTTFTFLFTEMHNNHQPSWKYYDNFVNYVSRTQFILQQGVPKVDLALYMYSSGWQPETQYQSANLGALGFTYDYVSPTNFDLPAAVVQNNTLVPDGPSYKALIFSNQTEISLNAMSHIHNYSMQGLPVLFVGSLPNTIIGDDVPADQDLTKDMNALLRLSNVHHVALAEDLPKALNDVGISPRVSYDNLSELYSVWRSDSESGANHAYLYNSGNDTITNAVIGFVVPIASRPYFLDAWSGEYTPIVQYNTTNSGISVNLNFQPGQSRIISFLDPAEWHLASPSVIVTNTSGSVTNIIYSEKSSKTVAQLSGPATVFTNESIRSFNSTVPSSFDLKNWDISIDDWHPHSNASIIHSQITTHNFTNQELRPWKEYPGMEDVSGIAKYNSSFTWPSSTAEQSNHSASVSIGAYVSFGPVVHTIRAWINDIQLPTFDIMDATVDISDYLLQGDNRVYIETASNLFNRVKSRANVTVSVGAVAEVWVPSYGMMPRQDYGLLGPVVVTPVMQVEL